MTTRNEIYEIVRILRHLPNSPVTSPEALDEVVRLFEMILQDLPVEMVRTAVTHYLSESNPFFPTPGTIRDKAMELQMLALGIPTAAEAWGMVLTARQYVDPVFCDEGWELRLETGEKTGLEYWESVKASSAHEEGCTICVPGGFRENYGHPAVAETVRLLGGRDIILTDNPVADRARFIEAYREVIRRERMKMAMTPSVAGFVEQSRPMLGEDRRAALDTGEADEIMAQEARRAYDTGENIRQLTERKNVR